MEQKPVRLLKRASLFEAGLVCGVLEQEGILFYRKEMGAGTMYCGGAIAGADVYVPESEFDRADEIMHSILNAEPVEDE
ncbi:MAG: DUF2007 domain-containing protein [Clostridia bacterium]|nr:DUF2007 domain-containing protein [Clostridia bacterium]